MKSLLGILGGVALLILIFLAWRYYMTLTGRRVYFQALRKIEPVLKALRVGTTPDSADLLRFAEDRQTRKVLFDTLTEAKRLDLFPRQYLTWEALADCDLVLWLWHPNELGAPPDEIELTARIPAPSNALPHPSEYFVFRFRTRPPHWAAKDGWMAGVAGPYMTAGDPLTHSAGTFSQFEPYDSRSPEEHVKFIHELAFGKSK